MWTNTMGFPEASESETQRIARGLRQKDAELIGELVDQYQYRLVRYLLYLTGRSESATTLRRQSQRQASARRRARAILGGNRAPRGSAGRLRLGSWFVIRNWEVSPHAAFIWN
jgi:hypothetical protein